MRRYLLTAVLTACSAATLSAATITSFTYVNPQNYWSTDAGGWYPIGVTDPGATNNPFLNPVDLPNGQYLLFFGAESYFPYYAGPGVYNSRLTIGFSDGTSTTIYVEGENAAFFATSNPIPHNGDQSILVSSVGNSTVDRVSSSGALTPNGVPDIILSVSNAPSASTVPEPATGGVVAGAFGLLAWMMRKRVRTVR
jgi:hypothetical protein